MCGDLIEAEIKKLYYLSKLKHKEEKLQNASLSISHDLINTLSPIISLSELLMYQEYPSALIADLEMIHVAGCNALDLSKNLLDAYKLDAKKLQIHMRPVNLQHFLNRYESDNVDVDISLSAILVCLDAQRIDQVMSNLLANAKDYAKHVVVRAQICGDSVEIAVEDNGIGIPDDKTDLLFQQFALNVNDHIPRSKPRTGLGLYICKGLVELHGGAIRYSTNASGGATF